MHVLSNNELKDINGGVAITAALINAIARIGGVILDLGRTVGTVIVRLKTGQICRF